MENTDLEVPGQPGATLSGREGGRDRGREGREEEKKKKKKTPEKKTQ